MGRCQTEIKPEDPELGIKTQIILGKDFENKIQELDSFVNFYDIIFQAEKYIPQTATGSDPNSNLGAANQEESNIEN